MLKDFVMLVSCATVTYLWLCAIVSPFATSARSLGRHAADRTAWAAFALAAAGVILWTVIVAGGVVLAMMLEPRAGLALLRSDAAWRGVSLGNIVWAGQLLAFARIPRVGPTLEIASALAIVALARDDARTLERVERLYCAHAIEMTPAPDVRSGAVRGVAA